MLAAPTAVCRGERVGSATPIPTGTRSVAATARAASTNPSRLGMSAERTLLTPAFSARTQSRYQSRDESDKALEYPIDAMFSPRYRRG